MPTYQDVTARVRALIGDLPNHYADDNYLLTYVNMAMGQLVSALTASGIREAMFTTSLLVPAGTSRIERWPAVATLPNEIAYSDAFSLGGVPSGWTTSVGAAPTLSSGISDPAGGTLGKRWSFGSGSTRTLYAVGEVVSEALSYFGGGALWVSSQDADGPVLLRFRVGLADDNGPIEETMEAFETNVTSEWQRLSLGFQGKVVTAAPTGYLRRCLELKVDAASPASIDLFRAVIRPTHADTDDVATNGSPAIAGRIPVIPQGIIAIDQALERTPGANAQWIVMRGPVPIAEVPSAERLNSWDWRAGGVDLNPAVRDREIQLRYWGELQDGVLGSNVLEDELPITGSREPLAFITAGLVSQARDQHSAAERFGVMSADGAFSGSAGGLVANLVTTIRKTQQSQPIRRQPYFGFSRYPGVAGNVVGAWPWNTN